MFPKEVPSYSRMTLEAPSKVFLLGEYAVLAGSPALVAAVGPRFKLKVSAYNEEEDSSRESSPFHRESPAGRLLKFAESQGLPALTMEWIDPHFGAGGFGASTAQFALLYLAYAQRANWSRRWQDVWKLYRELSSGESILPSGADLVAQWQGGVSFFDSDDSFLRDVWPLFNSASFLVFSATQIEGRKVPTHEHLKSFAGDEGLRRLQEVSNQLQKPLISGISAVQEGGLAALGKALSEYAEVLSASGLEVESCRADRFALKALPGVLGVKGAGALQSDARVVLMDPSSAHAAQEKSDLIHAAAKRGLKLVADGLECQMGVMCKD